MSTLFVFCCTVLNYEGVSKSFRTESITKYMLTTINTRSKGTQSFKAAKLIRLTQKIAIRLHLVAESCTICSSRSRRPVRKLLDTLSYAGRKLVIGLSMTIEPHQTSESFIVSEFNFKSGQTREYNQ
jgi:hypothetical protein